MLSECEVHLKQRDQRELETLLNTVESRLGTATERPNDLDCAQAIAHQLANVVTGLRFRAALEDQLWSDDSGDRPIDHGS